MILHYAKATWNLWRGGSYGQARGTVGSGLTPGSRLGRRTSEKTGSGSGNPEKTGKSVSRPFCLIAAEPGHLQTW